MEMRSERDQQTVWFRLDCPDEPMAFLVVRELATGEKIRLEMSSRGDGQWERAVDLPAGSYHARYYVGGERVIYYGPASAVEGAVEQDGRHEGLDALVHVLPQRGGIPS